MTEAADRVLASPRIHEIQVSILPGQEQTWFTPMTKAPDECLLFCSSPKISTCKLLTPLQFCSERRPPPLYSSCPAAVQGQAL